MLLLALILSTYHPPVVVYPLQTDTGMGKCDMYSHYHTSDGLCHRDSDDSPMRPMKLPVPQRGSRG